jgi:hypothetical protein
MRISNAAIEMASKDMAGDLANAGCKGGSPAKKRGFPKGGGKPAFEKSIKGKIFIDLFLCVVLQHKISA